MAKVVTSQGLQDFVSTGKPTETIANDPTTKSQAKLMLAKKLEAVDSPQEKPNGNGAAGGQSGAQEAGKAADPKKSESGAQSAESTAQQSAEDNGLDPEDHDLAERAKKRIGKKHYEMKKAQEEAAKAREAAEEADRFAETLFNERESWKRRAEEAERKANEGNSKPKEPEKAITKPDPQHYTDDKGNFRALEYAEALAEYSAKKAIEDERKRQKDEADQRNREAAERAVKARIDKATEKYPDWQRVVSTSNVELQNECLRFMAESEYGADIAYHLAKHPKDAERIRSMSPYLAVAELGKLQTQFEKPADPPAQAASKTVEPPVTRQQSGAPPPITPIDTSGAGSIQLDPAKMDFKQLRAYHRERRKSGLER